MWIISAFLVHLLLLGSVFVIYFRSPVISGLEPQKDINLEPPAKRLVLIVTDGLRAQSFFHNHCGDIPNLRILMKAGGLVGVSHTHVPTESRPGHIALIAGFYEDPSAVTRGWKENPIDFDTVFNRSAHTYAWGAHDVLHIFSHLVKGENPMYIDAYDHDLDFSGQNKTYELDKWVFKRARQFLTRKASELQTQEKVIFFLHLLGLDSAGHIHKPGSKLFLENLHQTDQGILQIVKHFEQTFKDKRTAFLLTSDHGMTNAGSHGSGSPMETETPFFIWGAGITNEPTVTGRKFRLSSELSRPLYELEQAQFVPLMSALLGLAPPVNNFGILPSGFLNVSAEFEVLAAQTNALQLLEQYKTLMRHHESGWFSPYLRSFDTLSLDHIDSYQRVVKSALGSRDYGRALNESYKIMHESLKGIEFYQGYYRNILLVCTTLAVLGWIYYLLQLLVEIDASKSSQFSIRKSPILCGVGLTVFLFAFLQKLPLSIAFYLIFPVIVWLAIPKRHASSRLSILRSRAVILQLVLILGCAELLVFTFFDRRLMSLLFFVFALTTNSRVFTKKGIQLYAWLVLVISLVAIPLLPPSVGYTNNVLFLVGLFATYLRSMFEMEKVSKQKRMIAVVAMMNGLVCIYHHRIQYGVTRGSHAVSWCFLVYTIVSAFYHNSAEIEDRIHTILFNFTCLYALFCTSYEAIFIVMLCSELLISILAHRKDMQMQIAGAVSLPKLLLTVFRLSFAILLYTFFSFFGTGNIPSISSFDPNIIRCFLTKFSPFLIMAMVIFKLIIPILLVICIIFGFSAAARLYERKIFICLLLICDIMGLNFLFLVKNQGSWLDIGSSISHFVIMEVTTLVLLALTYFAKVILGLSKPTFTKQK